MYFRQVQHMIIWDSSCWAQLHTGYFKKSIFQVRGLFLHYLTHQLHREAFNYVPLKTKVVFGAIKNQWLLSQLEVYLESNSGSTGALWLRAQFWSHSTWACVGSSCVTLDKFFNLSLSFLSGRDYRFPRRQSDSTDRKFLEKVKL